MSKTPKKKSGRSLAKSAIPIAPSPTEFDAVLGLIDAARTRAITAVNTTLIELYWSIGEYISCKIESAAWGEGVVEQLAAHIARSHPGLWVIPARICFGCDSFTKPTGVTKKSQHC